MKKLLLSILTLFTGGYILGQSIPNGGFENWVVTNYEDPRFFNTSNFNSGDHNYSANATKTTDAFHGNYAIRLTTVQSSTDTSFAFFANGDPGKNKGGLPYTEKPTGIRFHYKSNIIGNDSAIILVFFKRGGSIYDQYIFKIANSAPTYTLFEDTFSLSYAPDSIIFGAASSNAFTEHGNPGNWLQVDSIVFTGVNYQPSGFNGDLEIWDPKSNSTLSGWPEVTASDPNVDFRTTDAHSGNYALELQTNAATFGGGGVRPGRATTGIPTRHSGPKGGYPYAQQVDTFVFWYKYLPANFTDSIRVSISFSRLGVGIGGFDKRLGLSGNYKEIKMPYNLMTMPDSVIISLTSSIDWPDSLLTDADVGSDLKIDDMYFTSQKDPICEFDMPVTGCKGEVIQLVDKTLNQAGLGWFWIAPGGVLSSSIDENPTVTYNNPGTYNISMVAYNAFGNGVPVSHSITIYGLPNTQASSASVCSGTQATLTANGAASYQWSTGETTTTISVTLTSSSNYTVTGTTVFGCSTSVVTNVNIPIIPTPEICMVTADSLSVNNVIYWEKSGLTDLVDSFIVYRETTSNNYKRIGAIGYHDLSEFVDTMRTKYFPNTGDPNTGVYRYKLQIRDTCGGYGPMSQYHNTIYIVYAGYGQFIWSDKYLIDGVTNPVTSYRLICDPNNIGTWFTLNSISGNLSTIADNIYATSGNYPNAKWRVITDWAITCTPTYKMATVSVGKSSSNIKNNLSVTSGISNNLESKMMIYPNPANDVLNIRCANGTDSYTLELLNVIGERILVQQINGMADQVILDGISNGVYYVRVNDANGIIGVQKINIMKN